MARGSPSPGEVGGADGPGARAPRGEHLDIAIPCWWRTLQELLIPRGRRSLPGRAGGQRAGRSDDSTPPDVRE